jgi:hypothetical protein
MLVNIAIWLGLLTLVCYWILVAYYQFERTHFQIAMGFLFLFMAFSNNTHLNRGHLGFQIIISIVAIILMFAVFPRLSQIRTLNQKNQQLFVLILITPVLAYCFILLLGTNIYSITIGIVMVVVINGIGGSYLAKKKR